MSSATRETKTSWFAAAVVVCSGWFALVAGQTALGQSAPGPTIVLENAQLEWIDNVLVPSQDAGIVTRIAVRPNDVVQREQELVKLDQSTHELQVAAAAQQLAIARLESENDISLRYARKSAEVAEKDLSRSRDALRKFPGTISTMEIEQLDLEFQRAKLSGDEAKLRLSVNRKNVELRSIEHQLALRKLQQRSVLSPLDGQVAELLVQEGEWIDTGEAVARVVNLQRLRVVALVAAEQLARLQNGMPATLECQLADGSVLAAGQVTYVSPEINPVNRELTVWVEIENPGARLRPGLAGTLTIGRRPPIPRQ